MDRSGAKSRAGTRNRQPLGDGNAQANITATPPRPHKGSVVSSRASSAILPHHESMAVNGGLTVQNATSSPVTNRLSAVTSEESDKRSSQISSTSTASAAARDKKKFIGPWLLGNSIGDGSVGTVRKVRHSVTGQLAAAKIIDKKTADNSRAESMAHLVRPKGSLREAEVVLPFGIEREVAIMKLLDHENIVQLYDIWENHSQLYLIMEYVDGGELFDRIQQANLDPQSRLQEDEIFWIFRQIVAALLHAHRLGIYHRDLKPENLLLSFPKDDEPGTAPWPLVKLADFGMAALQPKGKTLKSPCGSIHYAAPEIFDKDYDGAKADVWSLGIILYVMFTGGVPFTWGPDAGEDYYRQWYDAMKQGLQEVPNNASPHACDLLVRMLQPKPKHRLSLHQVWMHPWFTAVSETWGETQQDRSLINWIGAPPESGRRPTSRRSIDRETLRNLCVLWHSETEEVLIHRLLSNENNMEKCFYSAIMKHRDEALENFAGVADGLSYSSSDHHHLRPVLHPEEVPPLPPSAFTRTKSDFSIVNDELRKSRNSIAKSAPSERSYDPFRASRSNVASNRESYSVTVRRGQSTHSRKQSTVQSVKPTNSLRVDALRREQLRHSTGSSLTDLSRRATPSPGRLPKRAMSRTSVVGSSYANSPSGSIVIRPSNVHKRGINFSRVRRSSTVSGMSTQSPIGTIKASPRALRDTLVVANPDSTPQNSIASLKAAASQQDKTLLDLQRARTRRSVSHNQLNDPDIYREIRKVSTELESYCDQSFNRTSASSSIATYGQSAYETPPSSISNRASTHSTIGLQALPVLPKDPRSPIPRFLPDTPSETPNTSFLKDLAETRKRMTEKYAWDPNIRETSKYREIISQIDALLESNGVASTAYDGRRIISDPTENRSAEYSGHLPIISEEDKLSEDAQSLCQFPGTPRRGPTSLFERRRGADRQVNESLPTVRLIDPSSPRRPAPLNVRKVSTTSTRSTAQPYIGVPELPPPRFYGEYPSPPPRSPRRRYIPPLSASLHPTGEQQAPPRLPQAPVEVLPDKKRHWFSRKPAVDRSVPALLPRAQSLNHRPSLAAMKEASRAHHAYGSNGSGNSPLASPSVVVPGKRPGFLSFLVRRKKQKTSDVRLVSGGVYQIGIENRSAMQTSSSGDNESLNSAHSNGVQSTIASYSRNGKTSRDIYKHPHNGGSMIVSSEDQGSIDIRNLGVQRNWLARFLNIKPAMHVMCFNIERGRARVELVRLLRSYERKNYGVCNVESDKERHLVFGRVAAENKLHLKEVAFVVQLFAVLVCDERANMTIARFTQRKGAASSFRIVTSRVEEALTARGLMVNDAQKCRDMEEVLTG